MLGEYWGYSKHYNLLESRILTTLRRRVEKRAGFFTLQLIVAAVVGDPSLSVDGSGLHPNEASMTMEIGVKNELSMSIEA